MEENVDWVNMKLQLLQDYCQINKLQKIYLLPKSNKKIVLNTNLSLCHSSQPTPEFPVKSVIDQKNFNKQFSYNRVKKEDKAEELF